MVTVAACPQVAPPRRPVGLTILAALGFFVALACAFLAVLAWDVEDAPRAIALRLGVPLVSGAVLAAGLTVGGALVALTSVGLLRGLAWAWGAGVGLCALSAAGDLVRVAKRDANGLLGLLVVGGMVAYLLRQDVRGWFRKEASA